MSFVAPSSRQRVRVEDVAVPSYSLPYYQRADTDPDAPLRMYDAWLMDFLLCALSIAYPRVHVACETLRTFVTIDRE